MKKPYIFSVVNSLLLFFLFFYVGKYLNPFVYESYLLSDTQPPESIINFVKFNLTDLMFAWVVTSFFLILKDWLVNIKIAFVLNLLFFLFLLFSLFYYPVFIDVIHAPF